MPRVGIPFDHERGERIERLRLERVRRFPTQVALADACGVAPRTMQRWVRGDPIEEPNLRVLAAELGVSVHYIKTGEEEPASVVGPGMTGAEQVLVERFSAVEERLAKVDATVSALAASVEQQTRTLALLAEQAGSQPQPTPHASTASSDANATQAQDD